MLVTGQQFQTYRSRGYKPRSSHLAPPRNLSVPTTSHGAAENGSASFILQGAVVGPSDRCESFVGPWGCYRLFCLLRSCSGRAKVLQPCRTGVPDMQPVDLRERHAAASSSTMTGVFTSLEIASGGIGVRSAAEHAPAAYIAIFAACRDICTLQGPDFDPLYLHGRGGGLRPGLYTYGSWHPRRVRVSVTKILVGQNRGPGCVQLHSGPSPPIGPIISISKPTKPPAQKLGQPQHRTPSTRISRLPLSGLLCSTNSTCLSGNTTPQYSMCGEGF